MPLPVLPRYPVLPDEAQRLIALAKSGLVGSAPDPSWDRLSWLATQIMQCPMALTSLLTSTRQWFKSRAEIEVGETTREFAFCSQAIWEETGIVVSDTRVADRFNLHPLVIGAPFIRFYAGIPVSINGRRVGTLCGLDTKARNLSNDHLRGLGETAAVVSEKIGQPIV